MITDQRSRPAGRRYDTMAGSFGKGFDPPLLLVAVFPATSSQDKATSDLVGTPRSTVVPRAEAGTGLHVYVGGTAATNSRDDRGASGSRP
jgi:hypothetical protein